jgi:hypothetical protein
MTFNRRNTITTIAVLAIASLAMPRHAAAQVTWTGTSGGDWDTGANWSTGSKPTASGTALFNTTLTSVANAVADQTVGGISFNTNAGTAGNGFTIGTAGGNTLTLGNGGTVQILSTLTGTGKAISVNAPLVLSPASASTAGSYTFANNNSTATNTLNFGGPISGGLTSGTVSLTLGGDNTGNNTIAGNISNGSAASLALVKSGGGTWVLSGTNTYTGGTRVDAGILVYNPAASGTVGLGGGTITLNGGGFRLQGPTTGVVALTNNFSLTDNGRLLWDVASSTTNAAVYSGNITFNTASSKLLTLGYENGAAPNRPLQLTGTISLGSFNQTIRSTAPNGANVPQILGNVDGGGIRSLTLSSYANQGILLGGNGGWNIKDLNVSSTELSMVATVQPTTTTTDYFSGIRANGGKVNVTYGQLVLNGGAYNFDDFTNVLTYGRINIDLTSRDSTIVGGTINGTAQPNGIYLTPGSGVLSGTVTVGSGGVMRNVYKGNAAATTKFGGGDLRLRDGAVYEVATGVGDWNTQTRLTLQAQNASDNLRLGDGSSATAETVTFRGSTNVPFQSPPPTRGFIMQFDSAQVVDDGNVVLSYETPTSNPFIVPSSTSGEGTYNSSDRLIFGWSDRTSSTIQYQFRGGSAGTDFVTRVAGIDVLGPTSGTVFTATSPTRLTNTGTVGFYNSNASMDRGSLGAVIIAGGGSLRTAVSGATVAASTITVNAGGRVEGIGTYSAAVTSNGIWAPGMSIGSNAVTGNLTLSGTSEFELGTPGTSLTSPGNADFTAVSGTLALGGNLALIDNANANSLGSYGAGSYRLFTAPTVSGTFASVTVPVGATTTRVGMVYTSGTASGQGVFANVYNLASAASSQTVNLGNTRVGTALTGSVTLVNSAPANATYTETLSTGNFSSTTTGFTTSGSASGIAGGGSGAGNLLVGLGTGLAAGAQTGTTTLALFSNAVNSSGLAQQSITSQAITITGTVWNAASANTLSTPINLGTVLKGTSLSQALSITNTAPSTFSEKLDATFGTLTGGATTNAGSISLLTAGGTSTAMTVGLGSATAGAKSGSVQVNFASNGDGTSGLAPLALDPQTVSLTATVLDPALPSFSLLSTLTSGTVNIGSFNQNTGVHSAGFSIFNLLSDPTYTADLTLLSITDIGTPSNSLSINLTGTAFGNLEAGQTSNWLASLSSLTTGSFTNQYQFNFESSKSGQSLGGPQSMTLTVTGIIVVPEPGSVALAGIGIAAAAYALRRRR